MSLVDYRVGYFLNNSFFMYIYEVTFYFISLWLHEHLRVNKLRGRSFYVIVIQDTYIYI